MNRRVEELCRLLEERGAAYMVNDVPFAGKTVTWFGPTCKWCAIYDGDEDGFAVAVFKDYLSPEQAVEATLGSSDEAVEFRRSVEEAAGEREPLTLFGVDYVAKQQESREMKLESVLRDIVAGDPRCTNRSCGDCEHDEDWECGISRRIRELGVRI